MNYDSVIWRCITLKISTKGRYALRLMIYIAANSNGKPISIKDVAKNEDISDKYLEQIISILNSGGLEASAVHRVATYYEKRRKTLQSVQFFV